MLYIWEKFIENDQSELSDGIKSLADRNNFAVTAKVSNNADVITIALTRSHPLFSVLNLTLEVHPFDTQRAEVSWIDSDNSRLSVYSAYSVDELAKTALAILLQQPLKV